MMMIRYEFCCKQQFSCLVSMFINRYPFCNLEVLDDLVYPDSSVTYDSMISPRIFVPNFKFYRIFKSSMKSKSFNPPRVLSRLIIGLCFMMLIAKFYFNEWLNYSVSIKGMVKLSMLWMYN